MNQLQVEAFRKLSSQDKRMLQNTYPDLYSYLHDLSKTQKDYKAFKKLQIYTTLCMPNKIITLNKKQLIACLYRKLPLLDKIKDMGGIQFMQFLSSFLSILRFTVPSKNFPLVNIKGDRFTNPGKHYSLFDPYNFVMGKPLPPPNDWTPSFIIPNPQWGKWNDIKVKFSPEKGNHVTIYDYVTVNDFLKMVKILYPNFHDQQYINILISKCSRARDTIIGQFIEDDDLGQFIEFKNQYKLDGKVITPDTLVLDLQKLRTFLIYIGIKLSKDAADEVELGGTQFTNEEKYRYLYNFKFSQDQIYRFLLAFPKEIYIDFLLNSDRRPEIIPWRWPHLGGRALVLPNPITIY